MSPDTPLAPIETALLTLVAAVETQAAAGPAAKACRAAIRRKGEEASQAGGSEAMDYLLRRAMPKATHALLQAVASGDLTPSEAADIGKAVDAHVRAIEATDLNARIERLEAGHR